MLLANSAVQLLASYTSMLCWTAAAFAATSVGLPLAVALPADGAAGAVRLQRQGDTWWFQRRAAAAGSSSSSSSSSTSGDPMQQTHTYIMCVMPGVNGEGDTFTLHPAPPTDAQMAMRKQQQHTEICAKRYTTMALDLLAARAHERVKGNAPGRSPFLRKQLPHSATILALTSFLARII